MSTDIPVVLSLFGQVGKLGHSEPKDAMVKLSGVVDDWCMLVWPDIGRAALS